MAALITPVSTGIRSAPSAGAASAVVEGGLSGVDAGAGARSAVLTAGVSVGAPR